MYAVTKKKYIYNFLDFMNYIKNIFYLTTIVKLNTYNILVFVTMKIDNALCMYFY